MSGDIGWIGVGRMGEAMVEAAYDGGDHTVFLGRVRWVERAGADGDPLLYFGGHYRRLGTPGKP